ncbi:manganese-dependent inorganic pyrophosphatase [Photobacterium sanguinicancri]|uniref:manganese-dependent inorganic pyrophosphatase n=1 Tax=Photobacterium sanguinicancri TaxID=875932 RepID=UPI0026E3462E|nr:manganese-dependent inorganic pyrophosphatase [Photobacterium sanguinicancri]MDO6497972.1 manganese-dependent inorganic pyrophosphatase [Photobacterium sanguinicancri]
MKLRYLAVLLSVMSSSSMAFDLTTPQANNTDKLVWTGHLSPDTDTVTSAIAAAYIYGGTAAVPEDINPESRFVLEYCKTTAPKLLKDVSAKQFGLVDFNQQTQLHKSVDEKSIVAIVDHHAIGGNPVNMTQVASIDIRPWGSAATILANHAETHGITLPANIACTTLGGILSDTMVFRSPTTTEYDRSYAEKLAKVAGIKDLNAFGEKMLEAKSDLSHVSAADILTLDYKNFAYGGKKVGIGVAETITAQQLLDRKPEFISAMKTYKKEAGLDHLFFSVIDTKNKRANLLWIDSADQKIANAAFKGKASEQWLVLEGVTSRKRQIGPAIQKAVEAK